MKRNLQNGFTLIELLVAIAISSMLIAVVALAFNSQSKSYNTQQDMLALQQEMRVALQFLAKELRMAGYDPTGKADAGIVTSTATDLKFTQDISDGSGGDSDGDTNDPNEDIRFSLNASGGLGREANASGTLETLADNIDQLLFEYLLEDGTWVSSVTGANDQRKIRAVKVMILGHSEKESAGFKNQSTFIPPLASGPAPDWTPADPGNFHWRLMSLIVQCRNLQVKK